MGKFFCRPLLDREWDMVAKVVKEVGRLELIPVGEDRLQGSFIGLEKTLWLIDVASALWSIWLAQNELVFNDKFMTVSDILFCSKLRALMWIKVDVKASFSNELEWWINPSGCLFSVVSNYSPHDFCPVFRVNGVKIGNKAACGGALFLKDGTIKAMFSGPILCSKYIGWTFLQLKQL
ncbi:hypothetical protein V6N13_071536 [Hibiscus sabdariffa]